MAALKLLRSDNEMISRILFEDTLYDDGDAEDAHEDGMFHMIDNLRCWW